MRHIAVMHRMGQIDHFAGPFVLGRPYGDLEDRAHLDFLQDVHHCAIQGHAHALIADYRTAGRCP